MTSHAQTAREILHRLTATDFEAFIVGGAVRDAVLGRKSKDFDITTSATPDQVQALFPGSGAVGAHFGVVLVQLSGHTIEVATYRSEGAYADGRHPDAVHLETDVRKDLQRRDFTINALLADGPYCPDDFLNGNVKTDVPTGGMATYVTTRKNSVRGPDAIYHVYDYVGGLNDIEAKVIRAIGNPADRFREDYLRMLRAVRFCARLGFTLEPETERAITILAPSITAVSAERTRDELTRILTEGGARAGLELLDRTGLLHEIIPEMDALHGCEQPAIYHPEGDVWVHTLRLLDGLQPGCPVELALAALLHDIAKPRCQTRDGDRIRFNGHADVGARMTYEILARLRYPNDVIDRTMSMVSQHMDFMVAPEMRQSRLKRFMRQPGFDTMLELHRLDAMASRGELKHYNYVKEQLAQLPPEKLRPVPLISGFDLIAEKLDPGPLFKLALKAVEDAQLDGNITTKQEALDLAHSIITAVTLE